jgi:hypothetical protein
MDKRVQRDGRGKLNVHVHISVYVYVHTARGRVLYLTLRVHNMHMSHMCMYVRVCVW